MSTDRSAAYMAGLVTELRKQPHETEWIEFKDSNAHSREIGEYLSALESSYAKVDTGWLAALCLELDGRTIAQGGV